MRANALFFFLVVGLIAFLGAVLPGKAVAQQPVSISPESVSSQRHQYRVESGPLDTVLNQFALVADIEISMATPLVRGKTSSGLNGQYSVAEGLSAILAGSGLTYRFTAPGIVAIVEDGSVSGGGEAIMLGPISVTAAAVETRAIMAPASLSIVTSEQLEKRGFNDLTDAIRNVPGVAVAGAADGENIFIRGLPSEYTMILIDGKRVNTRQSRTNAAGGVDQFYVPPVSAIDRIEIIRGPMSSLYGTDAMGGVINIITKRETDRWSGSATLDSTFPQASEDSSQQQLSFFLSGPLIADRLGIQLRGRKLDRSASERIENDRLVGPDERDLRDLNIRLSSQFLSGHWLSLELGNTSNEFGVRDDSRFSTALDYDGDLGPWELAASLHIEHAERQTEGSERRPEIENTIFDVKASRELMWRGLHQFTLGGQLADAELTDFNPGLADNVKYQFSNSQRAVFVENLWEMEIPLTLTVGGRYTDDERSKSKFTPRAYALWEMRPNLFLSAGVSTGFRAPELRESVEGYFLTSGRGENVIVGTSDLEPEESTNKEMGIRFENDRARYSLTVFETTFKNKIDSFDTGTTITLNNRTYDVFQYYNIDRGRARGLELSASYRLLPGLEATASYSHTDTEHRSGLLRGKPLSRVPKDQAELQLDWETPIDGLNLWSALKYQGESVQVRSTSRGSTLVEYEDYMLLDIGFNYPLFDALTIKGAVYNLADELITNAEHGTILNGRTLWLGLSTSF